MIPSKADRVERRLVAELRAPRIEERVSSQRRKTSVIRQAAETYKPAAVFVDNTCVPALHGDDIEAVAKVAAERFGLPVIPVDCAVGHDDQIVGFLYLGTPIKSPGPAAPVDPHDFVRWL